jgi:hypothetical protein
MLVPNIYNQINIMNMINRDYIDWVPVYCQLPGWKSPKGDPLPVWDCISDKSTIKPNPTEPTTKYNIMKKEIQPHLPANATQAYLDTLHNIMKAKMTIVSVDRQVGQDILKMTPVGQPCGRPRHGHDEDNTYSKYTPAGSLELTVTNPTMIGTFEPGDTYHLEFRKVPKPLTVDQMVANVKGEVEFGEDPSEEQSKTFIESGEYCVLDEWGGVADALVKWVCDNRLLRDASAVRVYRQPVSAECNPNGSKIWARIYTK